MKKEIDGEKKAGEIEGDDDDEEKEAPPPKEEPAASQQHSIDINVNGKGK